MATERLRVQLQMDAGQYKREAREASTLTSRIGEAAQKVRRVASFALLGAGAAMVGFAKTTISSASNLEESINAVEKTFGAAGEAVLAIGENSAESFGLAKSEFNSAAVSFAGFAKNITGEGETVAGTVETLIGRATDFASVMNLEVPEAMSIFQSTLAGQSRPIRQYGLDISDTAIKLHALETGLINTDRQMSEGEKQIARYSLLLQETQQWAGDFADTSGDLANKQRIFNAQLEDTKAAIGEELLPVMTDLLDVGQDLIPVLVEIGKFIGLVARGAALAAAGNDIDRIAVASGGAADSAAALATAIIELDRRGKSGRDRQNLRREFEELIDVWGGNATEIVKLRDGLGFLVDEMGLSAEHAAILAEMLDDALADALVEAASELTDAEQAARDFYNTSRDLSGGLDDVTEAVDRQGGRWDDVITSMENYEDMLRRLTDPVFKAIDDQSRLDQATQNYLDTIANPDATVGEQERAILDLVRAQLAAEESAAALPDDLDAVSTHLEILGRRAGITEEDLKRLRDQIMEFDGLQANATVNVNVVGGRKITGGNINTEIGLRQHGGPVTGSEPYLVGERGPELFVPAQSGYVISNADMSRLVSGMSNTHNYNIPIQSSGNQNTDAQLVGAVASVLRRMETL
jgi:hypothetical protein